jgi:hypothetical protein
MQKLNPTKIKILMLQKNVTVKDLMDHFQIGIAAAYFGISGARIHLHFKILSYLKSYKIKRKAA